MWIIRSLLILLILAVVIGFSVYNSDQRVQRVDLIRAEWRNVPMVVVVYWSMLAGMIAASVLGLTYVLRLHADYRAERRHRKRLEMEISSLRNRTIEELDEL
jgi:uncharacterized integral membrane protein